MVKSEDEVTFTIALWNFTSKIQLFECESGW